MFGFEQPAWHYLPHPGALMTALESMPEARRRFTAGTLPSSGRLLARHRTSREGEFRWAQVESGADEDTALVLDAAQELRPPVTPGAATGGWFPARQA